MIKIENLEKEHPLCPLCSRKMRRYNKWDWTIENWICDNSHDAYIYGRKWKWYPKHNIQLKLRRVDNK